MGERCKGMQRYAVTISTLSSQIYQNMENKSLVLVLLFFTGDLQLEPCDVFLAYERWEGRCAEVVTQGTMKNVKYCMCRSSHMNSALITTLLN